MNTIISTQLTLGVLFGCISAKYAPYSPIVKSTSYRAFQLLAQTIFWSAVIILKLAIETTKMSIYVAKKTPWNAIAATTIALPLLTLVGLEKSRKILMYAIDSIVISGGNKALREASQEIVEEVRESHLQPHLQPQTHQQLTLTSEIKTDVEEVDLDALRPGWNLDKNGNPLRGKILSNRKAKVLRELQQ
jgi:hypothetical protein